MKNFFRWIKTIIKALFLPLLIFLFVSFPVLEILEESFKGIFFLGFYIGELIFELLEDKIVLLAFLVFYNFWYMHTGFYRIIGSKLKVCFTKEKKTKEKRIESSVFRTYSKRDFIGYPSWKEVKKLIEGTNGGAYGLSGPRGAGKTWIIRRAVDYAEKRGGIGVWFSSPGSYTPFTFISNLTTSFIDNILNTFNYRRLRREYRIILRGSDQKFVMKAVVVILVPAILFHWGFFILDNHLETEIKNREWVVEFDTTYEKLRGSAELLRDYKRGGKAGKEELEHLKNYLLFRKGFIKNLPGKDLSKKYKYISLSEQSEDIKYLQYQQDLQSLQDQQYEQYLQGHRYCFDSS